MLLGVLGLLLRMLGRRRQMRLRLQGRLLVWLRVRQRKMLAVKQLILQVCQSKPRGLERNCLRSLPRS